MFKTPKLIIISSCLLVSACLGEGVNTSNTVPDQLENAPPAVPVPAVMGSSLSAIDAETLPATSDVGEEGKPEIRMKGRPI